MIGLRTLSFHNGAADYPSLNLRVTGATSGGSLPVHSEPIRYIVASITQAMTQQPTLRAETKLLLPPSKRHDFL
jgi:hypothetical protein